MTNEMKEMAKKQTGAMKGQYIVVKVADRTSNRVEITPLNAGMSVMERRRFTIMTDKVKSEGFWLCSIDSYKVDKNDHMFLVVKPLSCIGDRFNYWSVVWDWLLSTGVCWNCYGGARRTDDKYNEAAVLESFKVRSSADVVKLLAEDKTELQDVEELLHTPTEVEISADYVRDMYAMNLEAFAAKYPNLKRRIESEEGDVLRNIGNLLVKWRASYIKLGLEGKDSYVEQAEDVIAYYREQNAAQKELAKAKRKEAKKAKTA